MSARLRTGLVLACLATIPEYALAAPDAPAATSSSLEERQIRLPEPISTPIEYPEGQTERAVVVLELVIDVNGNVTDVAVVSGEPPFTAAALDAARSWRFVPAERNGRTITVRTRFTVNFDPPTPAEPVAAPSPEGQPKKPPEEPSVEVVVRGERPERAQPGAVTLTREETTAVPGTFGDPLRVVEAMPGVVPIMSGLPQFFVRGAPPANVGYFIDGIDVPLLYHAFFGPSVLHPSMIESVDLFSGAPPVEYGRYAGPVVSANLRPLTHRLTGEANVRIIDAGAMAEAPFGGCDGADVPGCSRGSVRVGGRYAYTGLILDALGDAKLNYWDYQGNASYAVSRYDTLSVLAFGAYDFFEAGGTSEQGGGEVAFHRVDLRWDRAKGNVHTRVALTGGYDSTGGVEEATSRVGMRSLRLRTELDAGLSDTVILRAGADGRVDDYTLDTDPLLLNFADYSTLFPPRTEIKAGAYLAAEIHPTSYINVVPGIRADVYSDRGTTKVGVDPRISADFAVSRRVTIEQSLGVSHQVPNFVPSVPAAQVALKSSSIRIAGKDYGLQQTLTWSGGVRVKLPAEMTASAAVFRNGYFDALDPLGGKRDFSIDREVINRRSNIYSMGLELMLKRSLTKKLGGFLAYTLSHTEQATGNEESVSGFDRPHVLQAALGYSFGSGYLAGARAVFYSGVPEMNLETRPHFTSDRRGRPYFRMDLRFGKRWKIGNTGYWGLVGEILNATSTSEVVRLDCGIRCVERVAGPVILPSVGVEVGF
ncbi:MAG TPA: TonB-dependent receptor [Polyangiaceae bacterium]